MERYIGLDVGYGFVKVTDGDSGYAFPSVVGEGDLVPSLVTGPKTGLHLRIEWAGALATCSDSSATEACLT